MHTSMGKKLLAGLLSVVMVLSLFATVPTAANKAEAASSWSLTGKTSVESLTTNNYVLKGLKTTQYAKVSVTGTAKAGVTVKKGSATVKSTTKIVGTGKNITFKLKNANVPGKKYTFTVKVYGKKSGKLLKTLKKTATVYKQTTEVAVAPSTATLKIGETVQLTTVVKPSTSTEKLTFASSNTEVATVDANGLVTAVAEGTTVVTVKSGSKYAFVSVAVTNATVEENGVVAKLEVSLKDTIKGMDHTYLANQDATVNVKALDANGNAVPNANVFFFGRANGTCGAKFADPDHGFKVLGTGIATTDANGNAVFVVASSKDKANDAFDTDYLGEVAFEMIVAGSGAAKTNGVVDFAVVDFGETWFESTSSTVDTLVPGTNATEVGYLTGGHDTYSVNKISPDVEYLASQQVSVAGTANHSVMVVTDPGLITPVGGTAGNEVTAEFVQEVNFKSDAYTVYDQGVNAGKIETYIDLDIKDKKLDYATVHINNIQLSKYTALVIVPYKYNALGQRDYLYASQEVIMGEKEQGTFGYQIPVTEGTDGVHIYLDSEGQVNVNKNGGFEVSKITGMYKKDADGVSNKEFYDAVKVNWTLKDSVLYDAERDLDPALAATLPKYNAEHKYVYKVPSFPQTGNAIITEYDQNNAVVAYFAWPTVNEIKNPGAGAPTEYATNKNVIDPAVKGYLITTDEATKITGAIKWQGVVEDIYGNKRYAAIVDAETVGVSPLMATVSVADANDNNKTVEGAKHYTSVHWNPVPGVVSDPEKAPEKSTPFIALRGQFIDVEAQIVDINGNKVSQSGVNVQFKYDTTDHVINANDTITNKPYGDVKVVAATKQTNADGVASIKFQAGDVATLANLTAKVAGNKYYVVLKVAGQTVKKADLYWIDANLGFKDKVGGTPWSTAAVDTIPAAAAHPYAGETWDYGFYVLGANTLNGGIIDAYKAAITNVGIDYKVTGMTDTLEMSKVNDATVRLTTKRAGVTNLKAKIDDASLSKNAAIALTPAANKPAVTAYFAGTGATNIDKSLTLPITWETKGITAKFVNPHNGKVEAGADAKVYLQVFDSLGYPVNGKKVEYSYGTATGSVTTNSDGIAPIDVLAANVASTANGDSCVVSATVDGVNAQTYSTIINYKSAKPVPTLVGAKYVNGSVDKIELFFNKDLDEKSINAKQFKVTDAGAEEYGVKAATVNGDKVTLTLAGSDVFKSKKTVVTVAFDEVTVSSIKYTLRSEDGMVTANGSVSFTANFDDFAEISATGKVITVKANADTAGLKAYAVNADGVVVDSALLSSDDTLTVATTGYYRVYVGNYVKELNITD